MRRPRPVAFVLTLASLAAATELTQWTGRPAYDRHAVGLHEQAPFSSTQTLEVSAVGASPVMLANETLLSTPHVFLEVDVVLRTLTRRQVTGVHCTLETGGVSYPDSLVDISGMPQPGFEKTHQMVFEVPLDAIRSPQLQCLPSQTLGWYSDVPVVDLGIDEDAVRQMAADTPQGITVSTDDAERVIR